MSEPHFFVSSRGMINLNEVVTAWRFKPGDPDPASEGTLNQTEIVLETLIVQMKDNKPPVRLMGDDIGEFMLLCGRYHRFQQGDKFP
jgi:hypothetical protein